MSIPYMDAWKDAGVLKDPGKRAFSDQEITLNPAKADYAAAMDGPTLAEQLGNKPMPIKRAKMVVDAERFAVSLGLTSAVYTDNLALGNRVNGILDTIYQQGLPMPEHVKISQEPFDYWRTQGVIVDNAPAAFTFDKRSSDTFLFINPVDPYWLQPKRIAAQQYQSGYWSTSQPFHAIYHEIGHLAHFKKANALYTSMGGHMFDSQERLVAAKISGYAIESPREFVAEVFARLATGGTVDSDVMMLYASLGGAKP